MIFKELKNFLYVLYYYYYYFISRYLTKVNQTIKTKGVSSTYSDIFFNKLKKISQVKN